MLVMDENGKLCFNTGDDFNKTIPKYSIAKLKFLKDETLNHWKTMINYAKKQNLNNEVEQVMFLNDLGMDWYSESCPVCKEARLQHKINFETTDTAEWDDFTSDCHYCLYAKYLYGSNRLNNEVSNLDCSDFCGCGGDVENDWIDINNAGSYKEWIEHAEKFYDDLEEMFNYYILIAQEKEKEDDVRY